MFVPASNTEFHICRGLRETRKQREIQHAISTEGLAKDEKSRAGFENRALRVEPYVLQLSIDVTNSIDIRSFAGQIRIEGVCFIENRAKFITTHDLKFPIADRPSFRCIGGLFSFGKNALLTFAPRVKQ
jgi:hypothetical protein